MQTRNCCIRFPECSDPRHLNEYLNQWETLSAEHGVHLPDDHWQSMLKNMLPKSVRDDVKKWLKENPNKTTPTSSLTLGQTPTRKWTRKWQTLLGPGCLVIFQGSARPSMLFSPRPQQQLDRVIQSKRRRSRSNQQSLSLRP